MVTLLIEISKNEEDKVIWGMYVHEGKRYKR